MTPQDLDRLSSRNPIPFGMLKKLELLLTRLQSLSSPESSVSEISTAITTLDEEGDDTDSTVGEESANISADTINVITFFLFLVL